LKLENADLKIKLLNSDRHLDCRVKDWTERSFEERI
jgi:hypothetical protein